MADRWYVGKNGNRTGPFTSSQVREMAATGALVPGDMLWKEGMSNWVQASTVRELFETRENTASGPPSATILAENPYAPPAVSDLQSDLQIDAGWSGQGLQLQYAEYLPRVGAALLDGLFVGLMGCIPAFGIGVVSAVIAGNEPDSQNAAALLANCCSQLLSIVIGLVYFVVLETSPKQGTWGKQIVGIKVTDLEGNRLTTGRAIGRFCAKFISSFTCGIAWLMPLFTEKKQTLHDMIAGCLALKK